MRKGLCVITAVLLLLCGLTACGAGRNADSANTDKNKEDKTLSVVTTIFPEYDWVREILGENPAGVEVTMLLDQGVDMHSYQPSIKDILKIADCDLFVYVGGESDRWVEEALQTSENENRKVLNLMEILGEDRTKEEEIVEGMQVEGDVEKPGGTAETDDLSPDGAETDEDVDYDEHIWLSLKNAAICCEAVQKELSAMDEAHAAVYAANAAAYVKKLDDLDAAYQEVVNQAETKTLLFGDRFPFRYLTDDYGLRYFAAFKGCSAETEASFETIAFLSKQMDELELPYILTIDGSDQKIAKTILDSTKHKDRKILTMDSMQSTTSGDVRKGTTYSGIMEENLEVLKKALGVKA